MPACRRGVDAIEVQLEISTRSFERLKGRRRSLAGRTGCGVCGVESFAGLELQSEPLPPHDWVSRVDLPTVLRAIDALPAWQRLNAEAGAIHAAGWATLEGELVAVLEDVGRHNALDKLIGTLARMGRLGEPGFVVLSSRGSHELVRKCTRVASPRWPRSPRRPRWACTWPNWPGCACGGCAGRRGRCSMPPAPCRLKA